MANNRKKNPADIPRPAVSVIMTTANRPHLIARAINCILAQTLKDFELIITDASFDNETKKIALRYNDPRITYIKCKGNIAHGRNTGLRHSSADYIAYCDDDELFSPHRLMRLKTYLDRHPSTGLVYSDALWYNISKKIHFTINADFDKRRLESECFFGVGNAMHRKECVESVGYFNESLNIADDWDMWLRIADNYNIFHLPETLHKHLIHGANNSLIKNDIINKEYEYIIKQRLKQIWNNEGTRRHYICQSSFYIIKNLLYFGNIVSAYSFADKFYRAIKNYQTIACRALCELARGDFKNAINLFECSVKKAQHEIKEIDLWHKKNIALIKLDLSRAYYQSGKIKLAAQAAEEAGRMDKKNNDIKIQLIRCYIRAKDFTKISGLLDKSQRNLCLKSV